MQTYLFDPDGGDLGIAEGNTRIEQIPFLVMRIADVFSKLRHFRPDSRQFVYCIQFNPVYKDTVKSIVQDIIREGLPDGVVFYETDGVSIFDLRGKSGGVAYAACIYLVTK